MRHTATNIILLIVFLTTGTQSIAQQQTYHNGFVAATNNGVWYLQDGFNEWVQLNVLNYDTVTAISFKDKLFAIDITDRFSYTIYPIFGNKISSSGIGSSVSGAALTGNVLTKNMTNKFKWQNTSAHITKTGSNNYMNVVANDQFAYAIGYLFEMSYFTSLATDNDSILVWTGTNNTLYKTVISPTVGYRSNTAIAGLTSNSASGHQICYDSNNDIFWIVSDEGIVYSYDKTTVVEVDQLPTSDYSGGSAIVDSVTDITASTAGYKAISVRTNDDHYSIYLWEELSDVIQIYSGYGENPCASANNNEQVLCTSSLGEYLVLDNDGNFKDVDDLPPGTVVYDLDYIDYMPWVNPDHTPPVITMTGTSPKYIYVGDTYVDEGATALDETDGDITSNIVVTNTVNNSVVGTYLVTYDVSDNNNNNAVSVSRTVYVCYAFPSVTVNGVIFTLSNMDITDSGSGIYAHADNNANIAVYGRLYTWAAAMRIDTLIKGWHIPSDTEWSALTTYLSTNIGGKMKETGTTHWQTPNTNATNSSGLTVLGASERTPAGAYLTITQGAYLWSSTSYNTTSSWNRSLTYNSGNITRNQWDKTAALSIRLIRD